MTREDARPAEPQVPPATPLDVADAESSRPRPRFRILLVEDDPAHALVVSRAIASLQPTVHVDHVDSGDAAIDRLRRVGPPRPDLILLDVKLPGMSGLDLLERIKTDPEMLAIPVVILTTSQSRHDRAEAFRRHANAYVLKPSNYSEFKRIAEVLVGFWDGCNITAHARESID